MARELFDCFVLPFGRALLCAMPVAPERVYVKRLYGGIGGVKSDEGLADFLGRVTRGAGLMAWRDNR